MEQLNNLSTGQEKISAELKTDRSNKRLGQKEMSSGQEELLNEINVVGSSQTEPEGK
jgi:hypothetical protein